MNDVIIFDSNNLMQFECVAVAPTESSAKTLEDRGYKLIFAPETHSIPLYVLVREKSEFASQNEA